MSREARDRFGALVDMDKQKQVEHRVTEMLQSRFRFVVFPVAGKEQRKLLESRLIATVSRCSECGASPIWFGRFSPKQKIRESGLWQERELYKKPFSLAEFEIFRIMRNSQI